MIAAFKPGTAVRWRQPNSGPAVIIRYEHDGFYVVRTDDKEWVVDEDELMLEEDWQIAFNRKRCEKCAACKRLQSAKQIHMPNPPFKHATDMLVESWNKCVVDNPCERWQA